MGGAYSRYVTGRTTRRILLNLLRIAGGGSYYFAKRSINAEKKARHEDDLRRRRQRESLEYGTLSSSAPRKERHRSSDHSGNPSAEASDDPAPTRHVPENEKQSAKEKSKLEPSEPYRARRGDRFS